MLDYILYSHSSYSDCWRPFFELLNDNFTFRANNYYIFSDKVNKDVNEEFIHIPYSDDDAYTTRFYKCLSKINSNSKYCLITHEDMFLYKPIHNKYFNECVDAIQYVDLIKLIKGGVPEYGRRFRASEILKVTPSMSQFIFSIQPTIWKTQSLLDLLYNNLNNDIWTFEVVGQKYCRHNFSALYTHHESEKKIGGHYDPIIYPYIATAIVKGKWNTLEYKNEINNIANKYGINLSIRGTND